VNPSDWLFFSQIMIALSQAPSLLFLVVISSGPERAKSLLYVISYLVPNDARTRRQEAEAPYDRSQESRCHRSQDCEH